MSNTEECIAEDKEAGASLVSRFCVNQVFECRSNAALRIQGVSYLENAVPLLRRVNHFQISTVNPNPIVNLGATPGGLYRGAGYVLKSKAFALYLSSIRPVSNYVRTHFSGYFHTSNVRLLERIMKPLDLSIYDLGD